MANNYTLGRGEISFARFASGSQTPQGYRYLGNTPEFNLTIESENLDHFNSDRGINEKDASVILSTNRAGSLITDNISVENVALFFFGSASSLAVTSSTVTGEEFDKVEPGLQYQLGATAQNPVGARKVSAVTVTDTAAPTPATYLPTEDYVIDLDTGLLTIVEGGGIAKGSDILVNYTQDAHTRSRIISGSAAVEGALKYVEYNPVGENKVWTFPYVKLSPNGDYALKGDEWQQIPFNIEVLKLSTAEAIYIDGAPMAS